MWIAITALQVALKSVRVSNRRRGVDRYHGTAGSLEVCKVSNRRRGVDRYHGTTGSLEVCQGK